MKRKLIFVVKLIVLVALYFICFTTVSSALFQLSADHQFPAEGNPALALLVLSGLNTILLTCLIVRSRWAGWKLIAAIFFILFGISTFMGQIETAYFVTRLPPGMLPRIVLSGAITAALFSAMAVVILGKRRQGKPEEAASFPLNMSLREWAWKLSLIAIAYLVIYFAFGYFIAWQSPAVRAYYGGSDPGSFSRQMGMVLRETPWLVPLQVVRAMLWTVLAVIVIRMIRGRRWEIGLIVGLLFAVLMNTQLLIPNPFMPLEVRMVHLLETASSNLLFGWLLVWVLCSGNRPGIVAGGTLVQTGSSERKRPVSV